MLHVLITIIHVLVCLVLCAVVLLQSSKGGGLAGAFGGGGGAPQQLLGSRGMSTLLHKVTIYCAVAFFITSFALFAMTGGSNSGGSGSVIGEAATKGQIEVPAAQPPLQESAPTQTPQPQGN